MSTTTIRLSDELKEQVALAAERAGTTPHAFILEAIAERVEQEARRDDFYETAERRYEAIIATGETVPWEEMRAYLKGRLDGKRVKRPIPRKLTP